MRILDSLIEAFRDIIGEMKEPIGEIKERIEERKREHLAKRLDQQVASAGEARDWRHSIVDLIKTAKEIFPKAQLDYSRVGLKQLAGELGYKGDYTGTAEQNIWMHDELLKRLADHNICLPPRV